MDTVSAEQRKDEFRERLEMMTNTETMTEDEKAENSRHVLIREQLMARLKTKAVTTTISGIEIKTRLMTSDERQRFIKHNQDLDTSKGDLEKYNAASEGLRAMASELAVEPGPWFWLSAEMSDDLVVLVLINTLNGVGKAVTEDIASFLPKQ